MLFYFVAAKYRNMLEGRSNMKFRHPLSVCTLGALCAVQAMPCLADATVVTQVTVTGDLPVGGRRDTNHTFIPFQTGNIRTLYHGDLIRIDSASGESYTVLDITKDRVIEVYPATKTFVVRPLKKSLNEITAASGRGGPADEIVTDTTVETRQETDQQTIAGHITRKIHVSASSSLRQESTAGPSTDGRRNRGGMGRGGGFPGGAGGGGFPVNEQGPGGGGQGGGIGSRGVLPSFEATGDFWMSEGIASISAGVKSRKQLPVAAVIQALAVSQPLSALVRPIADRLSSAKGIPLASHLVVSKILTNQDPSTPPEPMIIDTMVTSITEGNLDEALFHAPADYNEIKHK